MQRASCSLLCSSMHFHSDTCDTARRKRSSEELDCQVQKQEIEGLEVVTAAQEGKICLDIRTVYDVKTFKNNGLENSI